MRQDAVEPNPSATDGRAPVGGAIDWLRASLADRPAGASVSLAELLRACPYDAALLWEAVGFLEREQRVSVGADAVIEIRPGG
jgi:hypothetical protein